MKCKVLLFILCFFHLWSCSLAKLKLILLHNNDVHTRFLPISERGSICRPGQEDKCIAGAARTTFKVNEIRESAESPVLFLSAGDFFQGSLLYTQYKSRIINDFVFRMGYDVMTLGNHEFDDGVPELALFLKAAKNHSVDVVCTNLNISNEPKLTGLVETSVVKQFKDPVTGKNVSVGFVGYVTSTTRYLSSPGNTISFKDEITSVKEEVEKLKLQGVKIFIALGHSDLQMAVAVPEIDVIISGHTNTFMWPGTLNPNAPPPSIEKPATPYPSVFVHGDRKTLVVQAYAYGKYLGRLDVTFDEDGKIESFEGEPIYMGRHIPEHRDIKAIAQMYANQIGAGFIFLGRTPVLLEGSELKCRMYECILGNVVADAFVHAFIGNKTYEDAWTRYPIALVPSGDIRGTIDVLYSRGEVTQVDVMNALPFENNLVPVNVSGDELFQIFENSVATWDAQLKQLEGRFLQVSGIKVVYDTTKPTNSRVISIKARCGQCVSPEYFDVDRKAYYTVIVTDFLTQGGDGYDLLATAPKVKAPKIGSVKALIMYFKDSRIIVPELEGRITILNVSSKCHL